MEPPISIFINEPSLPRPYWRCWKWRPSRLVANGLEDVNTSRHVICSGPAKIGTPCQKPGNNREPCQCRTWDTAFWKFRLRTLRINMGTHRLAALRNQKRAVLHSLSWREGTTKSWQSQMWTQKITWPLPTHPHPLCLNPQCLGVWMPFSHWSCRLFGIRDHHHHHHQHHHHHHHHHQHPPPPPPHPAYPIVNFQYEPPGNIRRLGFV